MMERLIKQEIETFDEYVTDRNDECPGNIWKEMDSCGVGSSIEIFKKCVKIKIESEDIEEIEVVNEEILPFQNTTLDQESYYSQNLRSESNLDNSLPSLSKIKSTHEEKANYNISLKNNMKEVILTEESSDSDLSGIYDKNLSDNRKLFPRRLYKCDVCFKEFGLKSTLNRHIKIHTGDKPFTCEFCDKAFTWKGNLKQHLRYHAGEKPFECEYCVKCFLLKTDLKRHLMIHTEDKPFVCIFCSKPFTLKVNLKKHLRVHIGENHYECQYCQKRFNQSGSLKTHVCPRFGIESLVKKEALNHVETHTSGASDCEFNFSQTEILTLVKKEMNPIVISSLNQSIGHDVDGNNEFEDVSLPSLSQIKATNEERGSYNFLAKNNSMEELVTEESSDSIHSILYHKNLSNKQSLSTPGKLFRQRLYNCDVCLKEFALKADLKRHIQIHTRNKRFACEFCSKSFILKGNLTNHLRVHTGEKPFECQYCQKRFNQSGSLKAHLKLHTRIESLTVNESLNYVEARINGASDREFDFSQVEVLPLIKQETEPIVSSSLNRSLDHDFDRNNELEDVPLASLSRVKLKNEERGNYNISPKNNMKGKLLTEEFSDSIPCSIYQKNLGNKQSLTTHRKLLRQGLYRCDECLKEFVLKSTLNTHLKIHTGDKPFACELCNKAFTLKGNLKQHLRFHRGEKSFECEYCFKGFVLKTDLKRHLRTHNGDKPFACDFCSKLFAVKVNLKKHLMIHTGEKPYECQYCQKKFNQSQSLKTHLKIHLGVGNK